MPFRKEIMNIPLEKPLLSTECRVLDIVLSVVTMVIGMQVLT